MVQSINGDNNKEYRIFLFQSPNSLPHDMSPKNQDINLNTRELKSSSYLLSDKISPEVNNSNSQSIQQSSRDNILYSSKSIK